MSIKVSILIPLYNAENYISETIQSAINQTYTNIEVIVVDDGSKDNSYAIAKAFESERVQVYQQANKGASAARNKAFSFCTGDLIQYLDADDLLHSDKIQLQVNEFLADNDPDSIISGLWGRFDKHIQHVKWEEQAINKNYKNPINWLIDSWNGLGMAQPGVWLTPRHVIEKTGHWNESLSLNDDGEFFCRVLLNTSSIKYVRESKVYYRSDVPDSLSKTRSLKSLESELNSYHLYCAHTLKYLDNSEIRLALGRNYLNFIYQYYSTVNAKSLIKLAKQQYKNLKIGSFGVVGPRKFKLMAKTIGFINALKIKKSLSI